MAVSHIELSNLWANMRPMNLTPCEQLTLVLLASSDRQLTVPEIADTLSITPRTVHRARRRLRHMNVMNGRGIIHPKMLEVAA